MTTDPHPMRELDRAGNLFRRAADRHAAGDLRPALLLYDSALATLRPFSTTGPLVAHMHQGRADALLHLGDPNGAIAAAGRGAAAFLADPIEDKAILVGILIVTSKAFRTQGQLGQAVDTLRFGLEVAQSDPDPLLTAQVLGNLGVVLARRGDLRTAITYYEASLRIAEEADPSGPTCTWALGNLGGARLDEGRPAEAVGLIERAVSRSRKSAAANMEFVSLLLLLASSYEDDGQFDVASKHLNEAIAITTAKAPSSELHSRLVAAQSRVALEVGAPSEALRLAEEAVEILDEDSGGLDRIDRLTVLSRAYERDEQSGLAIARAREAYELVERLRAEAGHGRVRSRAFATKTGVHDLFARLLLLRGTEDDIAEAFSAVDTRKARSLADSLGRADSISGEEAERHKASSELHRLEHLARQARFGRRQADRDPSSVPMTQAELDVIAIKIDEQLDRLGSLLATPEEPIGIPTVHSVLAALPADQAVIQMAVFDESVSVWTFCDGSLRWRSTDIPVSALTEIVSSVRDKVLAGLPPAQRDTEFLAGAILAELPDGAESVVFVPDGPLHWLPFDILCDPSHGGFLGHHRRTTTTPSVTTGNLLGSRWTPPSEGYERDVFALGDPQYVETQFAGPDAPSQIELDKRRLSGSRTEVEQIAKLWSSGDPRLGADATEKAAIEGLETARIVHLACHGLVYNDAPLDTGFLLAPPTAEEIAAEPIYLDDVLAVYELGHVKTVAELVVGSACSTGMGPVQRGEGLIGLVGALLASGAKYVLTSLWPVDDHETATFMLAFHMKLFEGHSPDAALLSARRSLSASSSSSRHWAAWVLHGPLDTGFSRSHGP